ncbi:MAG: GNAT family N-acetyltransferase [Deltaproteobacteria bacterium]|nr:GNAT family N-acetyltransferase [Deltaproteobacteria bacterium]
MEIDLPRLILRELEEHDWKALHSFEGDPEVVRYQSFGPRSEEESREYIRKCMISRRLTPRMTYDMGVVLKEGNRLIGRCGLHTTSASLGEGVLWYVLHRAFWGNGYMPEAARALVDHGFRELRLHRIIADCDPENHPSIRVAEKLGMRREAHFRENAWIKGEWRDSLIFAVLHHEWPSGPLQPAKGAPASSARDP